MMPSHFLLLLSALALTVAEILTEEPRLPLTSTTASPSTTENVITDRPRSSSTVEDDATVTTNASPTTRRFRPTTRRPVYTTMRYRTRRPGTHPPFGFGPTGPFHHGCYHEGKWYGPGEEISRGYDGRNWCYGLYCERDGQTIPWDDWNCGPSTLPTTLPPRPYPTHSTRPGTFPPTRHGCYHEGKWYRPGEDMSRGNDGKNWCFGLYCDRDGQVVSWDDWNCGTTTPRPLTTVPPRPYPTTSYRTPKRPRRTTRRYGPRTTRRPVYTTMRYRTRHPRTYPPTRDNGCYKNGKWYRPGEEMSRGNDGKNWCYGSYCDRGGGEVVWDDWNCGPTTPPRPPPYPTTRYWTTRRPRGTTRRFRPTTRRPVYATMRYRTRRPSTHPPFRHGCYHEGKWYGPGEEISRGYDGKNWCYGSYCERGGSVSHWDNWNCGSTTPRPLTTIPPRPYPTTRYRTTRRPRGTTRRFRPTTRRPVYATYPLTRHGCYYEGKWFAPGEEISRGNRGTDWCYGKYCSERGLVIGWNDSPCETTTTRPLTTPSTPFPTTIQHGCYFNGRWYPPDTEISRGSSYGNCYGTVCDSHGQVYTWDDWRCSTTVEPTTILSPPPPPTTAPIRGCFFREMWYPPNSNIFQSSNGNGWCYGRRCSNDGQMVVWDNFNCRHVKVATGGCWYGGHLYAYKTELFRRDHARKCYGGLCRLNGTIKKWKRLSCSRENKFLAGRLRPSWCKYRGQRYPRGSVVFSRSLAKRHGLGWCYGAKCGENGRVVTWGPVFAPGHC